MRNLDDALKSLNRFESLVRNGLRPGKSLKKVTYKDRWDSLNFASLELRLGKLTVDVNAHGSYRNGCLKVWVRDFNNPSDEDCMFDMGADAEHVARVVVDYINEYEVVA